MHQSPEELREIYHRLKIGFGHELVNADNVSDLIHMAARYGDTQVEQILREWQAPCSDDSEGLPSIIAPTPGFNKDNVKR